jgi:stage V sporulation protein R
MKKPLQELKPVKKPVFTDSDWDINSLEKQWEIINTLAVSKYNWQGYPVQFEIVTGEQMLIMAVSHGMPISYPHWSFGKDFLGSHEDYVAGKTGTIYEMIINTNPCICYVQEKNTLIMQMLVTAHAAVGHNHFFKNNYMFKQWTKPEFIVDYLQYAKTFIKDMETKYGEIEIGHYLDLAHSLQPFSIDKYKRREVNKSVKTASLRNSLDDIFNSYNPLYDGTFSEYKAKRVGLLQANEIKNISSENLLKFIAFYAEKLPDDIRDLLVIMSELYQYYYPQILTKVMNEGFATYSEQKLLNDLYDLGYIGEGYMLENLSDHSAVCHQRQFQDHMNPYWLGYHMFKDIERMCTNPTEEDIEFCPSITNTDPIETINDIVANYCDETFILNFLSPKLIRDMKLFNLYTDDSLPHYKVTAIHNADGYKAIRQQLAKNYTWDNIFPNVECSLKLAVNLSPIISKRFLHFDELPQLLGKTLFIDIKTPEGTSVHNLRPFIEAVRTFWGMDVQITGDGLYPPSPTVSLDYDDYC